MDMKCRLLHAAEGVCRLKDNSMESLLFLHMMLVLGIELRLTQRGLYRLSHLTAPETSHVFSKSTDSEGRECPLEMIVGLFKLRRVTLVLLDLSWISRVQVNQAAVLRRAEQIQARRSVKKEWQVQALLSILSPHLTMHASFLKATVLNFPQDASKLKGLQLSVAYFNNSCMMMMGWRKITHLSKQVKNLITFEWPDRK